MCLLLALVVSPLWADFWDWFVEPLRRRSRVTLGGVDYSFPGVRLALWGGGLVTLVAGFWARRSVHAAAERDGPQRRTASSRVACRRRRADVTAGFVVLEGGDGTGKSTQARRLATPPARRGARGRRDVRARRDAARARLRELLLDGERPVDPIAEALLMAADRAEHVAEVVRPALARGAWVVSDRFVPSSLAYQGVGRGLGVAEVEQLNELATGGLVPDLVVVLDLVADVARAPLDARHGRRATASSARTTRSRSAVHEAYRDLARSRGWTLVDASGAVDDVEDARSGGSSSERLAP